MSATGESTEPPRDFEEALRRAGLELPTLPPRAGRYVPAVRTGTLVFCSGQGPFAGGVQKYRGKVGGELSIEQGADAARLCVLNCLAEVVAVVGSLSEVRRVVQVRGFVASAPGFVDQPKVVDGASGLLLELFGAAGEHARTSIGTSVLPGDIPVEIDLVVEVRDSP